MGLPAMRARTSPGLDLLYALAEAGVFGPRPRFTKRELAAVMGCTEGNLVMLEQSIFRKLRRKPELWSLWKESREHPENKDSTCVLHLKETRAVF